MKVCFVAINIRNNDDKEYTGYSNHCENMIKELKKKIDLKVIMTQSNNTREDFRKVAKGIAKNIIKNIPKNTIIHLQAESVIMAKELKDNGYKIVSTFHSLGSQRLNEYIFKEGIEICEYFKPLEKTIKNGLNTRTILEILNSDLLKEIYEVDMIGCKYSDIIIVPSNGMKKFMVDNIPVENLEKKIRVVPNGILENYFEKTNEYYLEEVRKKYNLKKDDFIVLTVGRITDPQKGLKYLIDAMKGIEGKLIVVGNNIPESQNKYFENIDVSDVIITGYIPEEEKKALYELCSVYIQPSIWEPFCITILEAMAKGKPIIASNTAGPKDIVKPSFGLIVDFNKPNTRTENLKENIKLLKEDILFLKQVDIGYYKKYIEEEARKEARKYMWDKVADRTVDVYKELFVEKKMNL